MKHRRVYEALKRYGFSPAKAGEIVLDATRHNNYAMSFVRLAFKSRR